MARRIEYGRLPVDLPRPYDADKMTAWKVDKAVGNVKNDASELIQPLDGSQADDRQLF